VPLKEKGGFAPVFARTGEKGREKEEGLWGWGPLSVRGDKTEEWRGFEMDPKFLFI
jgi:hypothetical protein